MAVMDPVRPRLPPPGYASFQFCAAVPPKTTSLTGCTAAGDAPLIQNSYISGPKTLDLCSGLC